MAFNFKLNQIIEEQSITRNALAREAKVRPNLIYEMCDNNTKRIELGNFEKILLALFHMTGHKYEVKDLIEYQYDE
ncbi:helix-turn-helix domain-containing protein [Paenibacillus shunpengii]|uniref:Helix-turn-helix domain-containing protein n=1 Tax=Paenibacillus shunpengii TaxID=2054424 RepID=A0ABW5SUI5_9BACL